MAFINGQKVALKTDTKYKGTIARSVDSFNYNGSIASRMYEVSWDGGGTYTYPVEMLITKELADKLEKEASDKIAEKFKEISKAKAEQDAIK